MVHINKSNDGKKIYYVVYNPSKKEGQMSAEKTCIGCTGYEPEVWDGYRSSYEKYCNVFGVWLIWNKPCKICIDKIRNKLKINN